MTSACIAVVALSAPLSASAELAVRSPFERPPSQAQSEVNCREMLELRGIMPSEDGMRFCIFDTTRNASTWVGVSEPSAGFVIRSSDAAAEEVTLDEQGRTVTLKLRESRVAAMTPEGNASMHAIAYQPQSRRQPGEPRAPKAAHE